MNILKERYQKEITPALIKSLGLRNVMEVPRIKKVLINIVLPRVRDFRGVSAESFDGRGNYTLGLREQIIFPEIEYDKVDKVRGMNIAIVTTAKTDDEARQLLKLMGMPFRN